MRTSKVRNRKPWDFMLKGRDVQLEADMQMSMIGRDMASWDLLQGFPSLAFLSSGRGRYKETPVAGNKVHHS